MVNLAVGSKPSPEKKKYSHGQTIPNKMRSGSQRNLRRSYISITAHLTGSILLPSRCQPYEWTLFGDKDGSLVPSPTQISFATKYNSRLSETFIFYDKKREPKSSEGGSWYYSKQFDIDRPEGERIESVQILAKDDIDWLNTHFVTFMTPVYYMVTWWEHKSFYLLI